MSEKPQVFPYNADPAYLSLGEGFADPVKAADFPQTMLRWRNDKAAATIGLSEISDEEWVSHFGRFAPLDDNLPTPLAMRYHGHQFRVYNPEIGDGRGFLFAQMRDDKSRLIDLATKGSGTTPWSRRGDGRLTLKGAVRELLATEMLEALGVNTSKTFSIIETGEELWRGDEPSPTRSAVLVRMSHGHIRIGTFQRLAALEDKERIAQLTRYCLLHYYDYAPEAIATLDDAQAAVLLLSRVVERTADLAASYMVAGFVHGVLNSDNINVSGESFDYGPWRFTPYWDTGFTAAYFDDAGLYAFGRQPEAIHWDVAQLAISLRPLSEAAPLIEQLERFADLYQQAIARRFLARLNVKSRGAEEDVKLVAASEQFMMTDKIMVDRFFFDYRGGRNLNPPSDEASDAAIAFHAIRSHYEAVNSLNHAYWSGPAPCSMHIDEVEQIWDSVTESDNWQQLTDKVAAIRRMGAAHQI